MLNLFISRLEAKPVNIIYLIFIIFSIIMAVRVFNDKRSDRNERLLMAMALVNFAIALVVGLSSNIIISNLALVFLIIGWIFDGCWSHLTKKNRKKRDLHAKKVGEYLASHPDLAKKVNRMTNDGLFRGDVRAVAKVDIDKLIYKYKKAHKEQKK